MTRMRSFGVCVVFFVLVIAAAPASAQFGRPAAGEAIGEHYHVELAGGFWNPTPSLIISSESLGIPGTDIDFVSDLGVKKERFGELRLALRPGQKHKFRIHYLPMKFEGQNTVTRSFVFNGIRYRVGLPVTTTLDWKSWRLAYEYDFLYRERWFAGLVLDAKYTDLSVNLESPIGTEFARARAPVPTFGGIGRVYVVRNVSITGELTGFKLPEIDEKYRAKYLDFDLYGTFNFTDNFGAQFGYRSVDVNYRVDDDAGDLRLRGLYFTGVARF